MTDPDLNEAVARKLGWFYEPDAAKWHKLDYEFVDTLPAYSTDIKAAWEIVEHCQKNNDNFYLDWEDREPNGIWTVQLGVVENVQAPTAPRAICEAFLKLP